MKGRTSCSRDQNPRHRIGYFRPSGISEPESDLNVTQEGLFKK